MIGSTSSDPAARVPGVYPVARPRAAPPAGPRTDVAGFVGFEPRVSNADSFVAPGPPVGHAFRVRVVPFFLRSESTNGWVPEAALTLSAEPDPVPIAVSESRTYAVVAVVVPDQAGALVVRATAAARAALRAVLAPDDAAVAEAVDAEFPPRLDKNGRLVRTKWVRIADVTVIRPVPVIVRVYVRPALPPVRCEDREDFRLAFGPDPDDGTVLAPTVRAFFANGGKRCHVVTALRPEFDDDDAKEDALAALVGVRGAGAAEATGLERLLRIEEVSLIDVPDLHACRPDDAPVRPLFAPELEAGFVCCDRVRGAAVTLPERRATREPVFDADAVTRTQRDMLRRVADERWRALLLLAPPLDVIGSEVLPPAPESAAAWRDEFANVGTDSELSAGALYYPWVLAQDAIGEPVRLLPPTGFAAGVLAKRDLARGPHVAAANETLAGAVGVTWDPTDAVHGELYIPDPAAYPPRGGVNLLRPFPGFGVQLWGARTLSPDAWLRYLTVRRGLSAIQRRVKAALEVVAFEPHTPLLWLHVTQLVLGVLVPMFEAGAFRGAAPEESFYVRCDESTNPADAVANGRLTCEVGVALAAPAEFLVFRAARRDGAIELTE